MQPTQLSSKSTDFYKRILPAIWMGFLTLFLLHGLMNNDQGDFWWKVLAACLLALASYFLLFKTMFGFVDEVYDQGDSLLIKANGKQTTVLLSQIRTVSYNHSGNPPSVTLTVQSTKQRQIKISFMPLTNKGPFVKNEQIINLKNRVEQLQD